MCGTKFIRTGIYKECVRACVFMGIVFFKFLEDAHYIIQCKVLL